MKIKLDRSKRAAVERWLRRGVIDTDDISELSCLSLAVEEVVNPLADNIRDFTAAPWDLDGVISEAVRNVEESERELIPRLLDMPRGAERRPRNDE